ncbi:Transcription factor RAX3, partial [Mucuna pruriens]
MKLSAMGNENEKEKDLSFARWIDAHASPEKGLCGIGLWAMGSNNSSKEDSKLKEYIENTEGNWIVLPQKAEKLQMRWLNYLRANIKHGDFSNED